MPLNVGQFVRRGSEQMAATSRRREGGEESSIKEWEKKQRWRLDTKGEKVALKR